MSITNEQYKQIMDEGAELAKKISDLTLPDRPNHIDMKRASVAAGMFLSALVKKESDEQKEHMVTLVTQLIKSNSRKKTWNTKQ